MSSLSDEYLFVLAIDFGTAFSGYAYSSRGGFKNNPLDISANQTWNAGTHRHISLKTPTCLLLNQKQKFESFGYEAETKYSTIVIRKKQNEYYFFRNFKMQLYETKDVTLGMHIKDVTGKSLEGLVVFSESIKALMKHFNELIKRGELLVHENEIRYVLTVPAIWSDAAKQFMRKSANMAGIKDDQLLIALEPEAASILCQYLPLESTRRADKGMIMSEVGTKYVVVDNGGGTCDITVHEKLTEGNLKELCRVSGADCGGMSVDQAFVRVFTKVVGAPLLSSLKNENPTAFLDLIREFEAVKRMVGSDDDDVILMSLPRVAMDEMCIKHLQEDFPTVLEKSKYTDQLQVRFDKLLINTEMVKKMLKDETCKIIAQISNVMKREKCEDVKIILLVGGFSECKILQNEVRANFPQCKVFVPSDPGLCVVKGAVLFGHRPDYITSRVARYTYGISINLPFDISIHDSSRIVMSYGEKRCKGCFKIFVKRNSEVCLGTVISKAITSSKQFQASVSFPVYRSTTVCPVYVDDPECSLIGELVINIPTPSREKRDLIVSMVFGNTELKVTATDVASGKECETFLNLM